MNRKQKKAKRLNATAHTKQQARVYITPKESHDIQEWNNYWILEDELIQTGRESQRFIKGVRVGIWIAFIISIILIMWNFWW